MSPTDRDHNIKSSATCGFSLVEMMIALLILAVSILGMTTLTLTSINANFENDLRNTAIRVTSEVAEELGSLPIENVVSAPEATRQVSVRGTSIPYYVTLNVTPLNVDLLQVNIQVRYTYKGNNRYNSAVVYKHRAS